MTILNLWQFLTKLTRCLRAQTQSIRLYVLAPPPPALGCDVLTFSSSEMIFLTNIVIDKLPKLDK